MGVGNFESFFTKLAEGAYPLFYEYPPILPPPHTTLSPPTLTPSVLSIVLFLWLNE